MGEKKQSFDAAVNVLEKNVNLIEASAGTGKTYAIAMLVLRFIAECSLKIEDILLVTFTRAATEELADRIRGRLIEARELLCSDDKKCKKDADPTLIRWAAGTKDAVAASAKIQTALEDIDRAAVFTIHGFSQRVLQEHALECDQLFDVELQPDTEAILLDIAEDFWRKKIYTLPERQCAVLLSHFGSPAALYRSVSPLSDHYSAIEPVVVPSQQAGKIFEEHLSSVSSWWQQHSSRLHQELKQLVDDGKLKKSFAENFPGWWAAVDGFLRFQDPLLPPNLEWLSLEGFAQQINGTRVRGTKKTELLNDLRLPEQDIVPLLESIDGFVLSIRVNFTSFLITELERRMMENNLMSYNDLIVRLHRAVMGADSKSLRTIVRLRYKAVLIDEFQDTDFLQWQIFSKLFGGQNHYLYLIGDPKQAIYRFRGADIYSYFLARKSAENTLTLEKNYRSHPDMVAAVNKLFLLRENPFFYRSEILDFSPVKPAKLSEDCSLFHKETLLKNMVYCQLGRNKEKDDGCWTVAKASAEIMAYVGSQIVKLLTDCVSIREGEKEKLVQPGDIAILVRNNSHAAEYQQYLHKAGVPAVVSSRNSVFQTDECDELYHVLTALCQPGNSDLLKRAMITPWFGLSGEEFYRISNDEEEFEKYHARFGVYAENWLARGLMVMMNKFLEEERVYIVLCSSPLAERKIANIDHLLELLQKAESDNMFGPLQLLQWLQQQMDSPEKENELRLEKDDDAVHIVTMHGAKGLEYPIVFCPYLWYRQNRIAGENNRIVCTEDAGRILDLGSKLFEERRKTAEIEEMAEDLRLLYVAVTRAKLRCYTFFCDIKGRKGGVADSFNSPFGYLVFPNGRVDFADQQERLREIAADSGGQYVLIDEQADIHKYQPEMDRQKLRKREFQRASFYSDWQMTSYSALASVSEYDDHKDIPLPARSQVNGVIDFADLPSGPNFGNIVHDILESVPFADLQTPSGQREFIQQKCTRYGVTADIEKLEKMLERVVSTQVNLAQNGTSVSFSLSEIAHEKCLKEMAFYFHLRNGSTELVNEILEDEKTVLPLAEKTLKGYLTGFVDLIFEYKNKFYIADYKTNYLGDSPEYYENEQLIQAMVSHNYGLQFWLYSLVLHDHLKNVLPGYTYEKHFGGVLYFFVRGMDSEGRGIFYHLPDIDKLTRLGSSFRG